jgi:hypothetical protein
MWDACDALFLFKTSEEDSREGWQALACLCKTRSFTIHGKLHTEAETLYRLF